MKSQLNYFTRFSTECRNFRQLTVHEFYANFFESKYVDVLYLLGKWYLKQIQNLLCLGSPSKYFRQKAYHQVKFLVSSGTAFQASFWVDPLAPYGRHHVPVNVDHEEHFGKFIK